MGDFASTVVDLFSRAAAEQGGVISGDNPVHYNASNPIRLWIIQLIIIIAMSHLVGLLFVRIRQPRVIAEVIAGILLGPSVMGRIPNFRASIFPDASLPLLNVTATVGLLLFLFIVGLELDPRMIKRNMFISATISASGLVLPLGMGAALGVGIYREFIDPSVNFGYFLLFTAVAMGITAFPVLCRILTELQLLNTDVGLVTLSAGIVDDVLGWVLLALTVALVNASDGLTALWVLLSSLAYILFFMFPVRWGYVWLARYTGSLERGSPTPAMMTVTLVLVMASAFFTDIIGVHAIFGGFLAGLIVPHENGYAISIVEKVEDLVTILLLPLYFTLSGLRTNLGLLNHGKDWGYIIVICLVAFTCKFCACGTAALCHGFKWREAGAIGSLMSCKGLVELIVLNIGLQAGVLDTKTFSMFVVHALVLTFMTTPLVLFFYPAKYRTHRRTGLPAAGNEATSPESKPQGEGGQKRRFALLLDKYESLSAAMTITSLLHPPSVSPKLILKSEKEKGQTSHLDKPAHAITIEALRLMELTNRTSAVLRSQEADTLIHNDPVLTAFRTFGRLNAINVRPKLSVVNPSEFPDAVATHVSETNVEMIVVPWPRGIASALEDDGAVQSGSTPNPFDGIFHKTTASDQTQSVVYSEFIRSIFSKSPTDVALFVERGNTKSSVETSNQHLFLPFFGGADDRLALSFLIQLCENPAISATVVRIAKPESAMAAADPVSPTSVQATVAAADTVYGHASTETRLASDTADSLLWEKYTSSAKTLSTDIQSALSRITFETETSSDPLGRAVELVKEEAADLLEQYGLNLIVVVGRSRRFTVPSLKGELGKVTADATADVSSAVAKTVGDVGAALVATNANASLLVVQAAAASA